MLPSDMVAEIKEHDFQDIADARIYRLLTNENRRLCAMAPFPFTEKFATWTETATGVAGVPLTSCPTDIRAVRNMGMPGIVNNAGSLSYLRRDYIEKTYGYNSYLLIDYPRHYNVFGRNSTGGMNLYVYPFIASNTIFTLDYHALPPVLGAASTEAQLLLPDDYADILMDLVLARLSRGEGDLTDGETFDARARQGIAEMTNAFDVNMDTPDPMIYTDSEDSWFG